MSSDEAELDATVARLLASETFEAGELTDVLVARGYEEKAVRTAIDRALAAMDDASRSPRQQEADAGRLRAGRLLRFGVFTLAVGLGWTLTFGGGLLDYLLVIAVGGAFLAAGFRGFKRGAG